METKIDSVHPWQRGFRPNAVFCPQCFSRNVEYTGVVDGVNKHHVYVCWDCQTQAQPTRFASPTFYAICGADNTILEKDSFFTPCIHGKCPLMIPVSLGTPICRYFIPADASDVDRSFRNELEERSIATKTVAKQPEPDIGAGGVVTDIEKARQERLKRLQEEDK